MVLLTVRISIIVLDYVLSYCLFFYLFYFFCSLIFVFSYYHMFTDLWSPLYHFETLLALLTKWFKSFFFVVYFMCVYVCI